MLYVVSWNAAGWLQTIRNVTTHHGTVADWLRRVNADVLCIQEAKVTHSKLKHQASECGADFAEYESFWSCCKTKSSKGFNGVTTFVRKGLAVGADATPFGDPSLDDEGRCLVTWLSGNIAVVNVYVPNDGPGFRRLPYKLKFLDALRLLICRLRDQGQQVILCGDINICYGPADLTWRRRYIRMHELMNDCWRVRAPYCSHCGNGGCLCKRCEGTACHVCGTSLRSPLGQRADHWIDHDRLERIIGRIKAAWPDVVQLLNSKTVEEIKVKSTKFGTQIKYRVYVHGVKGRTIFGQPHEDKGSAETKCSLEALSVEDEETHETFLIRPAESLHLEDLCTCLENVGVSLTEQDQRLLAVVGHGMTAERCKAWMDGMLGSQDMNMVDSFRRMYPSAQGRYTCWDQYKNRRYENLGARIDYVILEPSLAAKLQEGYGLSTGSMTKPTQPRACWSEVAALMATTERGVWRPAPFTGTGIEVGNGEDYERHLRPPGTGMFYTPPRFSDHIGVSVLLDLDLETVSLSSDKKTKQAQPHKSQQKLSSFFGKASASASASGSGSGSGSASADTRCESSTCAPSANAIRGTSASSLSQVQSAVVTQIVHDSSSSAAVQPTLVREPSSGSCCADPIFVDGDSNHVVLIEGSPVRESKIRAATMVCGQGAFQASPPTSDTMSPASHSGAASNMAGSQASTAGVKRTSSSSGNGTSAGAMKRPKTSKSAKKAAQTIAGRSSNSKRKANGSGPSNQRTIKAFFSAANKTGSQ